jgi:sialidase-1
MASLIAAAVPGRDKQALLFSNPAVPDKPRRDMMLKASLDDGRTWPAGYHVLIDAGESAGYSCLTMIDPQTIGLLYEGSRANLTFLRLPLAEVLGYDPEGR